MNLCVEYIFTLYIYLFNDHLITTSSNTTQSWTPGKNCQLSLHLSETGKAGSKKAAIETPHLQILLWFKP